MLESFTSQYAAIPANSLVFIGIIQHNKRNNQEKDKASIFKHTFEFKTM